MVTTMASTTTQSNSDDAVRLSRRVAISRLLAAAGAGALATRLAWSQGVGQLFGEATQLTDLGMDLSEPQRAAGTAFVQRHATVDVHCHPGRFFLSHLAYETPTTRALGEPFEEQVLADLGAGRVSAALFAGVSDMRLLELSAERGIRAIRGFEPGEAYSDYRRQVAELRRLVEHHQVARGLNPRDVLAARRNHQTAAIFSVEGGDFIEDRLDRVHEAFRDGVRAITVVHYHINQIGDIQTEVPVHNGLTPLGKSIIREMNAAGVVVDLAHATFAVTKDAVEVSTKPVMISHSNLTTAALNHPRLISPEHARLVASAGGIIGSVPSGIGQNTFADFIDSILRLVDAVGIDHVAIGTDMDANYRPVLRNYRDWGLIPAALLARGLDEAAVAKVMGENFLRIFQATLSGKAR